MTQQSWCTSFATVIGTSHEKMGTLCQDAGFCEKFRIGTGDEIFIAAVSDGAGSASKSDLGSKITVDLFIKEFKRALIETDSIKKIDKEFVINWLKLVRYEIAELATNAGISYREYACTVIGAVVGPFEAVFFQIGDGAVIVSKNKTHEYSPMFWPQHGEYANQTNFIIEKNFKENLEYAYLEEQFDKIALFTDGIERLVLDFTTSTVHSPAFSNIFDWLEKKDLDENKTPCPALTAYLNSDFINNRTDDDKTLVMAVRSLSDSCNL